MKFGEYLRSQKVPGWEKFYLDYDKFKQMIKELEEIHLINPQNTGEKGKKSMYCNFNAILI